MLSDKNICNDAFKMAYIRLIRLMVRKHECKKLCRFATSCSRQILATFKNLWEALVKKAEREKNYNMVTHIPLPTSRL